MWHTSNVNMKSVGHVSTAVTDADSYDSFRRSKMEGGKYFLEIIRAYSLYCI